MRIRRFGWWLATAAMAVTASPASAAWLKATSRHFVVYADTDDRDLRRQATELENFDALLRHVQHLPDQPDAEFNKVTVYVLPSLSALQGLLHNTTIAGIYLPRVTGSVAFTPRVRDGEDPNALSGRIVLFHEYAHHFLLGNFAAAYPAWFSEGYAEFASTVMKKDDAYWVGAPAQHRAYGLLLSGVSLNAAQLFAPPTRMSDAQVEVLYGRGWLLTHMIEFDPGLGTQFKKYLTLLNTGTPSVKAASEAFGDLKELDKKMSRYLNQSRISARTIKAETLPTPTIDVRPLGTGEAALVRLRMESTRGVDAKGAASVYARAKNLAGRLEGDAVAQGWLAEMAYDANDNTGAEKAADAALAIDPRSSQALLYKARVHLRRLVTSKSTDKDAWAEARSWIIKANRAQTNDAAALSLFYDSYDMQGTAPSKGAIAGIYRAVDLVPQDQGLRFAAARQYLIDGDLPSAKAMLRPLAFDPHAGADNLAARLLAALDAGATGPAALDALKAAEKTSEGGESTGRGGDAGAPSG